MCVGPTEAEQKRATEATTAHKADLFKINHPWRHRFARVVSFVGVAVAFGAIMSIPLLVAYYLIH